MTEAWRQVTGSVTADEMARAEKLAPIVRLKPSELVAIGLARVLDEIEKTGSLLLGPPIDWESRIEEADRQHERGRKRGKRPHQLFDN